MGLIITRGLGTDIIYKPVAVCKPEIKTKEGLKPVMRAERPPRVCEEEGE